MTECLSRQYAARHSTTPHRPVVRGLGRIGRAALKVLRDLADTDDGIRVAAVNDLVPVDNLAYLLRYDSVYGRYSRPVAADGDALVVDGHRIPVYSRRDPADLPWRDLDIDRYCDSVRGGHGLARRVTMAGR